MSRWIEIYESHPFQGVWNTLKENLNVAKVDDETVVTAAKELARLKKVISYIDGMLNSIDPELVPLGTWDSFNSQATPCNQHIQNFNSNRNIAHIQNESPRVLRRLRNLREWSHEQTQQIQPVFP